MGQCSTMGAGPTSRLRDPSNHVSRTFIREMGTLRPEGKVTYPGSLAGPAGARPHVLPVVHFSEHPGPPRLCLCSQITPQASWDGQVLLPFSAKQKKPCGSPGSHPKVSTPRESNQLPLARVNGECTSSQGGRRH